MPPSSAPLDGYHPHYSSETSLHTAFTCDLQWHHHLSHLRRPSVLSTSSDLSCQRLHLQSQATTSASPCTLRNIPRQTRSKNPRRSRLEAAHTDGVPRATHEAACKILGVKGLIPLETCLYGRCGRRDKIESGAQGSAWICHG